MQVNVRQQRADDRPLRGASRRRPSLQSLNDVLMQPTRQKFQQATVADALLDPFFQPGVRNVVEVALQIGIHHMGVAFAQQRIDFPQRVLAASTGPKSIARRHKLLLEDRLDHPFDRRLDDSVLHGRDAQRACLAARLGNFHTSYRGCSIPPFFQIFRQFAQIPLSVSRKSLTALSIYSRRAFVGLDLLPGRRQRLRSIDFVDQTEPFVSFDAVIQRRQHALRPDRAVDPRPISGQIGRGLHSLCRHCRHFACPFALSVFHASTFLPPFPRRGFGFRASPAAGSEL